MAHGLDDKALERHLSSARHGKQAAFTAIYESLAGSVAGYARGRGVDDTDELVNDVFLAAFRNLDTFSGDGSRFRSWLFGIAWNKIADWHRARGRRPVTVELDLGSLEELISTDSPDLAGPGTLRLLARLTDDQRDVLLLRIVADLSLAETAEALGKPLGAVKALQHRALAALARIVAVPVSPSNSRTTT